jgi:antitoxin HicB
MGRLFIVPLLLSPRTAAGYTVTSPVLPELVIEGRTAEDAIRKANEALASVFELYEYLRKPFPASRCVQTEDGPISFNGVLVRP